MSLYPTDLHVVSQTVHSIVIIDPPYAVSSTVFAIVGFLILVGGFLSLAAFRIGYSHSPLIALWLLPILFGGLFLLASVLTGQTSYLTLSADTGTLSVRKTFLSIGTGTQRYPLDQVRMVKVGVGDVCRFLYVSLVDRPAENLTSCTDRTGYSEVADVMNAFLDANRN